jgi:hypothetical protein
MLCDTHFPGHPAETHVPQLPGDVHIPAIVQGPHHHRRENPFLDNFHAHSWYNQRQDFPRLSRDVECQILSLPGYPGGQQKPNLPVLPVEEVEHPNLMVPLEDIRPAASRVWDFPIHPVAGLDQHVGQ